MARKPRLPAQAEPVPPAGKPVPKAVARPSSGKTPVSLLHEHAQRQKWEKVQYDMNKTSKGLVATTILQFRDPKSKEMLTVKFRNSLPAQETPIEARYFSACASLHRICFNKSLHLVLPREFKDIWNTLEDERKQLLKTDKAKHDKIYNNDPFKVVIEEKKLELEKIKKNQVKLNNESKVGKSMVITSIKKPASSSSTIKKPTKVVKQFNKVTFSQKVWDSSTSFQLSTNERNLIYSTIKHYIDWKKQSSQSSQDLLTSLGFRPAHIKEAIHYKDPLSFLLFNLPEDDLPEFFIDMTHLKDSVMIADKNEIFIKQIIEFGVSRNDAILNFNKFNNLNDSIIALTHKLIDFKLDQTESTVDEGESQKLWNEELEVLPFVLNENSLKIIDDSTVVIKFNELLSVKIIKPASYPANLVGLVILTNDNKNKLPNYVKQKILKKLVIFIKENLLSSSYSYISGIVEWLRDNCNEIIENPGSLYDPVDSISNGLSNTSISIQKKLYRSQPNDFNRIKENYLNLIGSKELNASISQRKSLPAWSEKDNILKTINSNRVSLITGETGSGKSTQLVQFLLDDLNSKNDFKTQILCTQPRRISAIGLAERVSSERCSKVGSEVGYIIRGVNKTSNLTRIKFLTTGILVKFLQSNDDFLKHSYLVIDEVHERSIETDLIIIFIKNLLNKFKNLKIVLMSATVNTDQYKKFFNGLTTAHIKGRTFPIQDFYLDDVIKKTDFKITVNGELVNPSPDSTFFSSGNINYELIASLVEKVDKEIGKRGSILIFMPGVAEISKCVKEIKKVLKDSVTLPLHSALSPQDQHKVFNTYKERKIIVSTNIAETSITIDDCVVTIDTGLVKNISYNPIDNTTRLVQQFESKAEAHQRRGRAGRVSSGISYKLFTKQTYESMIPAPIPEIKRTNLDSLYLVVKSMGIKDVIEFLNTGMDPPPLSSLKKSEELLNSNGLIEEDELTELGKLVTLLPIIDPKHGKLLILCIIFGMIDLGILLTSVLSSGNPFIKSQELKQEIKNILSNYNKNEYGDLISVTLLVNDYFNLTDNSSKKTFLNNNHLSYIKMQEIQSAKTQYYSILKDIGFIPFNYKERNNNDNYLNRNHLNINLLKAIISGAFYPQLARVQLPDAKFLKTSLGSVAVDPDAKLLKYWIKNDTSTTRAFIHPSSILFDTSNQQLDVKTIEEIETSRNDGLQDFNPTRSVDEIKPSLRQAKNKALKSTFITYNSSTVTSKLYLRDITPTSTLSVLLFGGPIYYDTNLSQKQSQGIVLDNWLPIKSWCRNAVLIKELRVLLDDVILEKLGNPHYNNNDGDNSSSKSDEILKLVESLV